MDLLLKILSIPAFLLGAGVFSFLGVVGDRVPKHEPFLSGRSRCDGCGRMLTAFELVPILSWLFLRGKCRTCGAKIGVLPFVLEVLGGCLAVLVLWMYHSTPAYGIVVFVFFAVLAAAALIDQKTMEIPNACHVLILVLTVPAFFLNPEVTILGRVIGFFAVSLPMLLLSLVIPGAFGGGDIKLMAACGLFLGWKTVLVSTFLAFIAGGACGIVLLAGKQADGKSRFAFGPFLCVGIIAGTLFGTQLLNLYLSLMF